jgi:8-oxo-dGTP diphosphatase
MSTKEYGVYTLPPLDFVPTVQAACCFCTCQGRFLLLRGAEHKTFGGTWGAPGGKLDPSETPLAAALRETEEETGIRLSEQDLHFYSTFYVRHPNCDFLFHVFTVRFTHLPTEITLRPNEHDAYVWVSSQEIRSLPLMPNALECFLHVYGDELNFS